MSCFVWVATIALTLTGTAAGAEEVEEKGFYVGAAVGQANHDFAKSDGINIAIFGEGFVLHVNPVSVDTEDAVSAWNATLGYRINRYVAAEISYMDFGDVNVVETYDTAGLVPFFPDITRDFNVALAGSAASVLGSIPVGGGFELQARIGYLFAHQDVVEGPFAQHQSLGNDAWIGGVGATWSFAKRWAVRLEYLRTDRDARERLGESKVEILNLGALFRL
ncbi:outer membrane beta-barrel protein [Povalibacter sp.]|uniref:outer membrane beta-barrel protein n=1 Tax=Povalibacter sp. TaxID=1962978 RepID=UPI002F426076